MDENKERLEEIKNSLTIEQVFDLLLSYGADPVLKDDLIICRTICHGGDSHKLYYYENTHLFRCYTECSDTFDIFQLVVKVESSGGRNYSLPQAINYVINFFNLISDKQDMLLSNKNIDYKLEYNEFLVFYNDQKKYFHTYIYNSKNNDQDTAIDKVTNILW